MNRFYFLIIHNKPCPKILKSTTNYYIVISMKARNYNYGRMSSFDFYSKFI